MKFEQNPRKQKLNAQQTKKLVPKIKVYNKLAKVFIGFLTKQIEAKEREVKHIRVMVADIKIPENRHDIMVETIDINNTKFRKKGSYSQTKKMDWESDFRNRNRGFIL